MDAIVNTALAEICSELQDGVALQTLWPRLAPSLSSSNLDLSPQIKQTLWDALRSVPTLRFVAKNAPYGPSDPSISSFEDAEKLDLKLMADAGLRDNFMGLYNVRSANVNFPRTQRAALERLTMARTSGITQSQLAKELGIEGRNFHYTVKHLECQGLIVKQSALLRTKEAGDEGESRNSPCVTTNMLYLFRHAKHLGSQQKIEIIKEEQRKEGFGNGKESSASGDGFAGKMVKEDVLVKDYLPKMKAVCDKLKEANGKVLVVSDIKKDLGYTGSPAGHKSWRNVCSRLKSAGIVELFDAKVNEKVESCLRFLESSSPMSFEPKTLRHVDDDCDEEQQVKLGKRKKSHITDQLVELPIEQQIYELIDATGSEGSTRNEVLERLGITNKKSYNRIASMPSRFGMHLEPEMQKKAKSYRCRTSGKHNSESVNAFLNKAENGNENKITDLCVGSLDAVDSLGQNPTPYDSSTLKGDTARSENMKNRDINTEPSCSSPGNPQLLLLGPKDTTSDTKLSLLSTTVEINGSSPNKPLSVSKRRGSGSDPRYPCLPLTEDSARREKRILERLQDDKFILRAELYRWLVSMEKDKCTTTDRKTIDRILKKLQLQGRCKCIHINIPVVTNCGRSRTTLVVLHPSIQSLSPELVSQIHDTWRSFEIQSRGRCSSRWKNSGRVPVLKDVQRTQNHASTDIRAMKSEAMRANGFILAKMIRAKLLHSFLWDYLCSSTGSNDALSSGKDDIELINPHSSSKLFSLEVAVKAIPVEMFLQVVGSTKKFDDMIEKCKRGLCLSDLSAEEYRSLMDTHATGRLSLVIEILRRLKLLRMVGEEHLKDTVQVPHAIPTHALELKPYIEEPLSKDAISLSFGSPDLRPRIRHDFVLSNREAVDEYWETLEYCYAAADPRAALHAFPGSAVHEVSMYRSWTKLRVMTAAQRDELLKRVEKDDRSEKLSFKECGKIAKDLNLTLEQVLRVYYDKRRQQNKTDEVQTRKSRRASRKKKRSLEQGLVKFTEIDELTGNLEEQGHATLSDTVKQFMEEKNLMVTSSDEHDTHLQPLADRLETEWEAEPNEGDGRRLSKLKSARTSKKEKLQSTRQRRFSWTEEADRKLVIQYVRHRATLGANIHRIDWASLPDLPAPPSTCQKRMTLLKSNRRFRTAVMRLCNMISERYAKLLEKTQNRSLSKDDCRLLLRGSTGEDHNSKFPNTSNHNQGADLQEEPWDDFEDHNIKKALEEVLHYKRMAKLDASKGVGSTCEDWSDLNKNAEEYDTQESELSASTTPYEDVQNSGRGLKISARRSCCQHLNEKFFKLLHGVNVSTQVYKSLAVSNAVELFKLVFLSTSTAPEVSNLLAEILRRYSECDLFAAFNYLRDRKIMVGGNDSQHFSLSQQFLHNISMSPFPTNSGKRAIKFAHWLHERDKDLMEGGIDLSADLQCGDVFHLFALVSSGELSISPCLPDEGVGECEDLRSSKRKIDSNEFLDGDKTKKLKSFVAAEGEIISRREKGFPGIKVSVYRAAFSTANSVDFFNNNTPGEKQFGGNHQLDSTSGHGSLSHPDHMKEILDSASTIPVLENSGQSPWGGMVQYSEHLLPSHSAKDQSSPINAEVFRSVYSAVQKAGDQGLSIDDVSQITNIPGEKMTEFIIDVLQTFERVLKVNAYDSIRLVDSLYRGKYFMTSVPGSCQKLGPPSSRNPLGGDEGDLVIHPKDCDIDGAHSQGDINMNVGDIHKVTFLNFPEEVSDLSYEKQTSSVPEVSREGKGLSPREDNEDESAKSSSGKLCVPILPWINGDGTINKIIYKGLRRRVLGIVMQNPGILEDEIIRRMDVLNPQSCRKLLELLILDKHIHVRKMHQTTANGLPPMLRTFFGSSFIEPKLVCREHFFANPMSTSLL